MRVSQFRLRMNLTHFGTRASIMLLCWLSSGAAASEPRIERLDSGLRIVVIEDRALPLVSVQLWFRTGSVADPPVLAGLTHVAQSALAHRGGLLTRARMAGLRAESRTFRDACVFHSFGPAALLDYMLELEAERIRPYSIREEFRAGARAELAALLETAQRGSASAAYWDGEAYLRPVAVPRDERFTAAREPSVPAISHQRRLLEMLFAEHAYARPPTLLAPSLDALEPERLDAHLAQWFVPANATLLIHGDVEAPAVLDSVRRRFAGLCWSEAPRLAHADRPAAGRVRETARGASPELHLAWWMPAWVLPENVGAHVLMHHLCNSVDGSLRRRLENAGVGPPRWEMLLFREAGALILSLPLHGADDAADQFATAERIVNEELRAAAEASVDVTALRRAKALAVADLRSARAGLRSRAALFGAYDQIAGDLFLARFDERRIERFTPAGLRAAAEHLLATRCAALRVAFDKSGEIDHSSTGDALRPIQPAWERAVSEIEKLAAVTRLPAPPVIERRPAGEFAHCETIRVADAPTSCVVTLLPGNESSSIDLERRIACLRGRWEPAALRDVLSYRGWTLRIVHAHAQTGVASEGPPADWPQLIELHAELLRAAGEAEPSAAAAARGTARRMRETLEEYADRLAFLAFCPSRTAPGDSSPKVHSSTRPVTDEARVRCIVVSTEAGEHIATAIAECWSRPFVMRGADACARMADYCAEHLACWVRADGPPEVRQFFRPETGVAAWRYLLEFAAVGRNHRGILLDGGVSIPAAADYLLVNDALLVGYQAGDGDVATIAERGRRWLAELAPRNDAQRRAAEFGARVFGAAQYDGSAGLAAYILSETASGAGSGAAEPAFEVHADRISFLVVGDSDALREAAAHGRVVPIDPP